METSPSSDLTDEEWEWDYKYFKSLFFPIWFRMCKRTDDFDHFFRVFLKNPGRWQKFKTEAMLDLEELKQNPSPNYFVLQHLHQLIIAIIENEIAYYKNRLSNSSKNFIDITGNHYKLLMELKPIADAAPTYFHNKYLKGNFSQK